PTVCVDVISLVASSCGYTRGAIEPRVAQSFTAHAATQRARGTSTTAPAAARAARRAHAGASRQSSTADPEALHRSGTTPRAGAPGWPHRGGETTPALHPAS